MKKYILSIDQGTTSSRAILFNKKGELVASVSKETKLIYPHEGYVEQDAIEIWSSVVDVINNVLIKANAQWSEIDSVGITNQRETTVVWDKKTGTPIYNAIVWQSRQSLGICEKLSKKETIIHNKTGLLINPYFSASKVRFILDAVEGAQARAEKGELLFGTIDTWVIWKLTNGKTHATDTTNASRTMLFNIFDLCWDKDLLEMFNIPAKMLPKVCSSKYDYGKLEYFNRDIHILGVAGDQQASLFGHTCFKPGDCKNTYGTGCFMLMNTGEKPILSNKGLLTTIAWTIDGKTTYALEGSVFIGGAAIQWLRDGIKIIKDAPEVNVLAVSVKDNGGVYFVPAFVGLGTPYWDDEVRGTMFGITRGTTRGHIALATLQAIAFQSKDVFDVMSDESQIEIKSLQVDGGATNSDILMQFQSDILQIEITKPSCLESTALGVCYLAGLKSGFFKGANHIKECHSYQKSFSPQMSAENAKIMGNSWKKAVESARRFKL